MWHKLPATPKLAIMSDPELYALEPDPVFALHRPYFPYAVNVWAIEYVGVMTTTLDAAQRAFEVAPSTYTYPFATLWVAMAYAVDAAGRDAAMFNGDWGEIVGGGRGGGGRSTRRRKRGRRRRENGKVVSGRVLPSSTEQFVSRWAESAWWRKKFERERGKEERGGEGEDALRGKE